MKALTLTQPWATLVAIGAKRIETRSWGTSYRGPLAIHAAKAFPRNAKNLLYAALFLRALDWPFLEDCLAHDRKEAERYDCLCSDPTIIEQRWLEEINARIEALPLGAVIATVKLVHCIETDLVSRFVHPFTDQEKALGDYESGRYGWLFEDVEPLAEPIPAKGALGLWEWSPAISPPSKTTPDASDSGHSTPKNKP